MNTIQEIEQAVSRLCPEELARFRQWFDEFDAKEWDRQFEADAKSGRLDARANQALNEFEQGQAREL